MSILSGGFLLLVACDLTPKADQAAAQTQLKSNGLESKDQLSAGILPVAVEPAATQIKEILFYLHNDTDEAVLVLPWNTPLEKYLSADLFTVSIQGEKLPYIGRVVKRAAPGPDDYIGLAAGDRLVSTVKLSQGYDLNRQGEYQIVLESLYLQGPSGTLDVFVRDDTVIFTNPPQ